MAKRHRTRPRQRRATAPEHRTAPRTEREVAPTPRPAHRQMRARSTGYARAVGAPSQSLLRASVVERGYIFKDFKRMGLLVGIALVLLVAIGMAQSAFLAR